jgi:hypothetical protein
MQSFEVYQFDFSKACVGLFSAGWQDRDIGSINQNKLIFLAYRSEKHSFF